MRQDEAEKRRQREVSCRLVRLIATHEATECRIERLTVENRLDTAQGRQTLMLTLIAQIIPPTDTAPYILPHDRVTALGLDSDAQPSEFRLSAGRHIVEIDENSPLPRIALG